MNDRLAELLPWYVNGTLAADERVWVEGELAAHPDARAELGWYRSLASRMQENAPQVAPTLGLEAAMARIEAEQGEPAQRRPVASNSPWTRLTAFFAPLQLRPAVAFAGLAIFALQSAVIFHLARPASDEPAEIRAVKATAAQAQPMLKVNFAPDAKEADIRLLLVSVQGRLAGGPGQLGDYYLIVPAGKEDAMAAKLQASRIVQAVALAPGLPPRE